MVYLLVISLFFCLQSCEYTNANSHRSTTQFRFQDMQFHDTNGVILPDAAENVFLAALSITLFLDTQKNCARRELSTMEATYLLHGDPFPACARHYLHLRKINAPPNTPICAYYDSVGTAPKSVPGRISWRSCRPQLNRLDSSSSDFSHTRFVPITYVQGVP